MIALRTRVRVDALHQVLVVGVLAKVRVGRLARDVGSRLEARPGLVVRADTDASFSVGLGRVVLLLHFREVLGQVLPQLAIGLLWKVVLGDFDLLG